MVFFISVCFVYSAYRIFADYMNVPVCNYCIGNFECVFVFVCVCVRESERERARERASERRREFVFVCEREREREREKRREAGIFSFPVRNEERANYVQPITQFAQYVFYVYFI